MVTETQLFLCQITAAITPSLCAHECGAGRRVNTVLILPRLEVQFPLEPHMLKMYTVKALSLGLFPKHTGAPNDCRCALSTPWPFLLFVIFTMVVCTKTLGNLGKLYSFAIQTNVEILILLSWSVPRISSHHIPVFDWFQVERDPTWDSLPIFLNTITLLNAVFCT